MMSTAHQIEENLTVPQTTKYFICRNNPVKSFSLELQYFELVSFTLSELFERAILHYNEQPQNKHNEINPGSFQLFYNCHFDREKQLINTPFASLPIYFIERDRKRDEPKFQIFVKFLRTDTYFVDPNQTVLDLINMINQKRGFVVEQIMLRYCGYLLENTRTLSDYKIECESSLSMTLRLRGGCSEKSFVDLENEKSQQQLKFSTSAPEYRVACEGINIEGNCQNKECKYYDKLVISQIGIKDVEIIQDLYNEVNCPNRDCKKSIKIQTCGFTNCQYQWSGLKIVDGKVKQIRSPLLTAPNGSYTRYNPQNGDGSSNQVKWKQLFIIATELPKEAQPKCFICQQLIKEVNPSHSENCLDQQNHKSHDQCRAKISVLQSKCLLCVTIQGR